MDPFRVMLEAPEIVSLSVMLLMLEITPFITSEPPPPEFVIVCVAAAAAPRIMGASIVFVPLEWAALTALVVPVPVFVRVSLVLEFELVRSYPEESPVEKFNS